ncbi:MAG: hypothetical protein WCI47_02665 [bacterium]
MENSNTDKPTEHRGRSLDNSQKAKKLWRTIKAWVASHKALVGAVIVIGGLVGAGYYIYNAGYAKGVKVTEEKAKTAKASTRPQISRPAEPRGLFAYTGTVVAISDSEIEIKTDKDGNKKVAIEKTTQFAGLDGKKIELKVIKKGDKVSANGTEKPEGGQTLRRIRLVK